MVEVLTMNLSAIAEANRRPEKFTLTAKCEVCDWEMSIQSVITKLPTDGATLNKEVLQHEQATRHSVRTFQRSNFSKQL